MMETPKGVSIFAPAALGRKRRNFGKIANYDNFFGKTLGKMTKSNFPKLIDILIKI
jgi:hypothetical protein